VRVPDGDDDTTTAETAAETLVSAAIDGRDLEPACTPGSAEAFSTYIWASSRPRILQLPPALAVDVHLRLLAALAPVSDASLWVHSAPGTIEPLAWVGEAAPTRRVRACALAILVPPGKPEPAGGRARIQGVPVLRFGSAVAALVVRTMPDERSGAATFVAECAAGLAPVLEREALLARSAQADQELHAASERRLRRLAFDLHDGPLQDIAALAADLQLARRQVAGVLEDGLRSIVVGRFDDLAARLTEIDHSLRELSHSLESSSVVDRSLPEIVRREVTAFDRRMGIETTLEVRGRFDDLSASQRIALFRIAQEALSNVRDHTDATEVSVSLERLPEGTRLCVTDNGRGFDVAQTVVQAARRGRLGLVGMNERVRLLGGTFSLQSEPGAGTELTVVLPEWRPASALPAAAVD
jgi:signal transduction histidine kinase